MTLISKHRLEGVLPQQRGESNGFPRGLASALCLHNLMLAPVVWMKEYVIGVPQEGLQTHQRTGLEF